MVRLYVPARVTALVLGLCALALLPLPATASAADNLLGQWHLDSVSNNDNGSQSTPDSSGNGRDLSNCTPCLIKITGTGGRFGGFLNGTNVNPATTATGIHPLTVTLLAWVRDSATPTGDQVIAQQSADNQTCNLPSYRLAYEDGHDFSGLVFSVLANGNVVKTPPVGTNGVWDGNWHLVTGTYDGSTARLFVDGNEVGSGTPAPGGSITYGSHPGVFGVDGYTGDLGCVNRDFVGDIDELRVYDRALKGSEIKGLADAPGGTPPDVVVDSDGDGVPDSTDNCPNTPNPDQAVYPGTALGRACHADSDGDGVPDSTDNCPRTANPDQTDNDHNGVGAACQKPVAALTVRPNPTCTALTTTFDASASHSDSPITHYQFLWDEDDTVTKLLDWGAWTSTGEVVPKRIDSASPVATYVFDWNIAPSFSLQTVRGIITGVNYVPAQRRDVNLSMYVTNAAGLFDFVYVPVHFAQHSDNEARTGCQQSPNPISFTPQDLNLVVPQVTHNAVVLKTTCKSTITCLGAADLTRLNFGGLAAAKKKKKKNPLILGLEPYAIPPGKTERVAVPLTKPGLKLLKKLRKLKVKVSLLSVSPTGKKTTRSKIVTLKAPKPKKKK